MTIGRDIPIPPPELLFQISLDPDQKNFRVSVETMTSQMLDHINKSGISLAENAKILDFGCGVGKLLIGLYSHNQNYRLYGCDLDNDVIKWCNDHLKFADCYRNNLMPPLKYPDRYFDFIIAISVFTHLSLQYQFLWAWELWRVLAPGGILYMTTHGPPFFGLFTSVASTRPIKRVEMHWFGSSAFMLELEQPVKHPLYRSKKGADAQGQLEIAVAHTLEAVALIFAPFNIRAVYAESTIGNGHDAYILQKPKNDTSLVVSADAFEKNMTYSKRIL